VPQVWVFGQVILLSTWVDLVDLTRFRDRQGHYWNNEHSQTASQSCVVGTTALELWLEAVSRLLETGLGVAGTPQQTIIFTFWEHSFLVIKTKPKNNLQGTFLVVWFPKNNQMSKINLKIIQTLRKGKSKTFT